MEDLGVAVEEAICLEGELIMVLDGEVFML